MSSFARRVKIDNIEKEQSKTLTIINLPDLNAY
jgi:hypothetical protein